MLPSLSIVTKRAKSSLQTIRLAVFAINLIHERSSGFSLDPIFLSHGLVSFNDIYSAPVNKLNKPVSDICSGLMGNLRQRRLTFKGSFVDSCLLNSVFPLLWMARMSQKTMESARLSKMRGSAAPDHGEKQSCVTARW